MRRVLGGARRSLEPCVMVRRKASAYLGATGSSPSPSPRWQPSPPWWMRCFGSFMGPGPRGGADLAPNPASHHVSRSWPGLPKANSLCPRSCKPSWASPRAGRQTAASPPCLWALARALFVFSSVRNIPCVSLPRLISYNAQLLLFLSSA